MEMNFWVLFVTALLPLIVGSLYYNPKTVGGAWMDVNGFNDEDLKGGSMMKVFIATYVLGIFLSFIISGVVIHQTAITSVFMGTEFQTEGTEAYRVFTDAMSFVKGSYRSFGHGVLHGVMIALFLVWPVLSINAMFERRGWKYVAIHLGYWVITIGLMGGILCKFL